MIDAGLEVLESDAGLWEERARILSELRSMREKQPFEYSGDLVGEARQEQEEERERIWRGDA